MGRGSSKAGGGSAGGGSRSSRAGRSGGSGGSGGGAAPTVNKDTNNWSAKQSSGNLQALLADAKAQNVKQRWKQSQTRIRNGGYDGGGNSAVQKIQAMSPDVYDNYLQKIVVDNVQGRTRTGRPSRIQPSGSVLLDPKNQDRYGGYHNNPWQAQVLKMGLNDKATPLNKKDFNAYCKATGQTPMYRGWGSASSKERFENSKFSHMGTGVYGDGLYFASGSNAKGIANTYGFGGTSVLALSPTARRIKLSELHSKMPHGGIHKGTKLAGSAGSRSYGRNSAEAQWALKLGYNVIDVDSMGGTYHYAITRDALVYMK